MAFETLRYEVAASGVATVTLDQPETRNALSDQVLDELIAAFEAARDDEAVRCVVLTSSHEKVFSSGANLGGFAEEQPLVHKHLGTARFPRLFRLIGELGKPTICAANGHVLAGALGLALACDLIVAREGARFGTPEINVGAFPFMIMALIYRNVPRKKTTELLLLGEQISAEEAERIGIVNQVVPRRTSSTPRWPTGRSGWRAKSPLIMRLGKDAMFRQQDMAFLDALDYLRAQLTLAFSTDDIHEGVKAFFEKREPYGPAGERASAAARRTARRAPGRARRRWRERLGGTRRRASRASPPCATGARTCPAARPVLEAAAAAVRDAFDGRRAARADRLGLLDLHRHAARGRAARARRARRLDRRARRLQHAGDDAERLPRRHVPGRVVRALGGGRLAGDAATPRACTCSACATSTRARRPRSRRPA